MQASVPDLNFLITNPDTYSRCPLSNIIDLDVFRLWIRVLPLMLVSRKIDRDESGINR